MNVFCFPIFKSNVDVYLFVAIKKGCEVQYTEAGGQGMVQ